MSAVWMGAMAQLRGRARVTVLLGVLVGLAGGVVLAAVAGARRTDAALPRFVARDHTIHALVYPAEEFEPSDPLAWEVRAVAVMPGVAAATRVTMVVLASLDEAGPTDRGRTVALVPMDAGGSRIVGQPVMVAGRLPDERQPDEAVIDEELAAQRHLEVGSVWRVGAYIPSQIDRGGWHPSGPPNGPPVDLRIVGIIRRPVDLVQAVDGRVGPYGDSGDLYLTPAYGRRYGRVTLANFGFIAATMHRGQADLGRLEEQAQDRFGGAAGVYPVNPGGITANGAEVNLPGLRRAMALESGALLVFAALAGVAGLLLVGQTLGRQISLESVDYPTLRALGMTRAQLVGVALVRAAVLGGAAAVIGVVTAVACSPLAPIGLARRTQPHPGVAADLAVLAPGALAVFAVVAAGAGAAAWWASRSAITARGVIESGPAGPRSRLAGALAAAGMPTTAVIGTRLALEPGRGRTAVPVRAAMVGAAAAVGALTAAGVPAAHGWTWDVSITTSSPDETQQAKQRLDAIPAVSGYLGLLTHELLVDSRISSGLLVPGKRLEIMAIQRGKGPVPLQILEGREPVGPDEIALGTTTMGEFGKRIGDILDIEHEFGPTLHLRIVGRVVLNTGQLDPAITPGKGAVMDIEAFRDTDTNADQAPLDFLVRLDPSSDRSQALDALQRSFPSAVVNPIPHPDIANLARVSYLPGLLAAVMGLLALATVIHTLASSVRRRRRDLAVLKTLGFLPRQVSATVAWQATAFATAAALAGLPLGIVAGRWAWQLVAVQLGVVYQPVVPLPLALAVAAGTFVAAILVAAGPGWVASRIPPATLLRSE